MDTCGFLSPCDKWLHAVTLKDDSEVHMTGNHKALRTNTTSVVENVACSTSEHCYFTLLHSGHPLFSPPTTHLPIYFPLLPPQFSFYNAVLSVSPSCRLPLAPRRRPSPFSPDGCNNKCCHVNKARRDKCALSVQIANGMGRCI